MTQLPAKSGTYILHLALPSVTRLQIGRLGHFELIRGHYLYVGSAFGPGGLRSRINHHRNPNPATSPHWHLDYLRAVSRITTIWYTTDPLHREHDWAATLHELPATSMPIPRFGGSDCTCPAHFFHLSAKVLTRRTFADRIHRTIPHHASIFEIHFPLHPTT